ncbi:MAG: type II secretion system protein GspK [Pseudomonadota bacterium]
MLLGLAFLGALAMAIAGIATDRLHRARNVAEAARAEALAEAGFAHAMAKLTDRVADPLWRADGRPYSLALSDGVVEVTIHDEAGRIDLNMADEALLRNLMIGVGMEPAVAERLVDAILDWADPDDLRRLNGAEAGDYRAAGLDYSPANRPFVLVGELTNVLGMRPDIVRRLEPHLTVHSRLRGIDPTVAPRALLALLPGVQPEKVQDLLVPEGIQPSALGQYLGLDPRHVVASRRQVYSIRAVARTTGGGVYGREATIRLLRDPAKPYAVLAWRRASHGGETRRP